jgi:hypothetical protein
MEYYIFTDYISVLNDNRTINERHMGPNCRQFRHMGYPATNVSLSILFHDGRSDGSYAQLHFIPNINHYQFTSAISLTSNSR